ncbi:hypothetical protein AJ87_48710 [Rhizobium yanglingense]|nr:hypothetical protein AJ87_48710 [Rhizobium yanglingense]
MTAEDLVGEDYPIEVRFMNELPPEEIIWSGSLAEARQVLHSQLFSPAAREALGIRTDTSIEEDDDILG